MGTSENVTEQLRELAEMRKRGDLTEVEFRLAKAALLDPPADERGAQGQDATTAGSPLGFMPARAVGRRMLGVAGAVAVIMAGSVGFMLARGPGNSSPDTPPSSVSQTEASTEPDEAGATDSDDASEPVDLAAVDWADVLWSTTCTEDSEPSEVRLSEGDPVWGQSGALAYSPDPSDPLAGVAFIVEVDRAIHGDVTGNGASDAVFLAQCFLGNDSLFSVEVWGHDAGGVPVQFPPVLEYSKWDGQIVDFEIVDGMLRVHTREPVPGDEAPHLGGYPVEVITDWALAGGSWTATEVSRVEPEGVSGNYGSDPELDQLWDRCAAGDIEACEWLYITSPVGSVYEWFGATCGDRYQEWACGRFD